MKRPNKKKPAPSAKEQLVSQLYDAVNRYVEGNGGKLIIIGGIELQEWPTDTEFSFRVAVRCCGRKPELPATK